MKSKNIQFGDRRKIKNIPAQDTLFDYPPIVRKIEAIRNRIVHDGSFDFNQNLYTGWITESDSFECCILFPDFDASGNFVSYKNRCNFHSESTRINLILPKMLFEILELIKVTISKINLSYNIQRYSNFEDFLKYKPEIENWPQSFVSIITKDLTHRIKPNS